ncbi:MAG: D-glycerate dehydrogenase [Verrucomicrobia bacterium]|nr:D-glycerate dehydrogenase [Verrucomicrobiota bacterium]
MRKIFITRKLPGNPKQFLQKDFQVDENDQDELFPRDKLIEIIGQCDGILSTIPDRLDAEMLGHAKKLKVISNWAAGLDNIDLVAAEKQGIKVFNLPDTVTESTADLTMALFLSLVRRIPEGKEYVLSGKWRGFEPFLLLGEELRGKVFGIIGYGRIGRAVAQRAAAFGMKVIAYHLKTLSDVTQVPLEELYATADYISLHVPLKKETKGMIGYAAMQKMKKHPILINMARGSIINTDDLVRALKEGVIRGAALDVTDPEPLPNTHPLCQLPNCLIIPHIGSATIECRTLMSKIAADNLREFFHAQ